VDSGPSEADNRSYQAFDNRAKHAVAKRFRAAAAGLCQEASRSDLKSELGPVSRAGYPARGIAGRTRKGAEEYSARALGSPAKRTP